MVTYSYYESDNRVMRYAEALAQRGDVVEVFALRRSPALPRQDTINGVTLHRIQDRFGKTESSKYAYVWPLLRFLFAASWRIQQRKRYDLLHVHSVPDFLILAAWYAKLRGSRVILDIHDIAPEFFASKFRASERSAFVRGLKLMERLSAAMADHIILANHLWLDKYTARSAAKEKCSVFINYLDRNIFRPRPRTEVPSRRPLILFPGGLHWHQGVDIAIRAFGKLRCKLPSAEFHIYGDGSAKAQLIALVDQLGLTGSVRFFDPLPIQGIAQVMAEADLAVVPKRADSFGNEAYSTKIMEFMGVGVPLVVSNTRIDRYYFDDSVVRFFESGSDDALAKAMFEVLTDETLRRKLVSQATEYVVRNSWERHSVEYLRLVDSLIAVPSVNVAKIDRF